MFYLKTHSTHFIYGYMASDIWLRIILIVRKETRCRLIGYSYRLTARVFFICTIPHTYHGLCYTSRGALAGTRNISMGPTYEGSISVCILLFGFVFKHDVVAQCERIRKDGAGVRRNSCLSVQWSKHPF